MEKAILNVDNLNISQGMNWAYSHKGDLAIDICNCSYLRAPFTGVVKRIYKKCNAVWLESKDMVEYADGTVDYMTVLTMHDNNINLSVGQVIKQGEIYYHPGTKGISTGSHIHIAIGKGKFFGMGWYRGEYQPQSNCYAWPIYNQYDITRALYLDKTVKKTNYIYDWTILKNKTITKYLNLKPTVDSWTIYKTNNYYIPSREEDILARLNPRRFGGLTYKILEDMGNYHFKIKTEMFGICYIAGNPKKYECTITNTPIYMSGNY